MPNIVANYVFDDKYLLEFIKDFQAVYSDKIVEISKNLREIIMNKEHCEQNQKTFTESKKDDKSEQNLVL